MNPRRLAGCLLPLLLAVSALTVRAQETTPPATHEEREALYTRALERRVDRIMERVDLKDAAKTARVRTLLLLHYRTLRARDEVINARLRAGGKDPDDYAARAELRLQLSKPLHEWFVSVLALELSPAQVEAVKDVMTYDKVKVTAEAYARIIPGLKEADLAWVIEQLKAAREEAMHGGSADEKSAIFQKFKDAINAGLNARGYDVAKAYRDWEARQAAGN